MVEKVTRVHKWKKNKHPRLSVSCAIQKKIKDKAKKLKMFVFHTSWTPNSIKFNEKNNKGGKGAYTFCLQEDYNWLVEHNLTTHFFAG